MFSIKCFQGLWRWKEPNQCQSVTQKRKTIADKPPPLNRAQTDDVLFAPCFDSTANTKTRQEKHASFHACCRIFSLISRKFSEFQDIFREIDKFANFSMAIFKRCRGPPLLKFWFSQISNDWRSASCQDVGQKQKTSKTRSIILTDT